MTLTADPNAFRCAVCRAVKPVSEESDRACNCRACVDCVEESISKGLIEKGVTPRRVIKRGGGAYS